MNAMDRPFIAKEWDSVACRGRTGFKLNLQWGIYPIYKCQCMDDCFLCTKISWVRTDQASEPNVSACQPR